MRYVDNNSNPTIYYLLGFNRWNVAILRFLLERGAHVDYADGGDCLNQALQGSMRATEKNVQDALYLLLHHGADPCARNRHGFNPSDIACCERANSGVFISKTEQSVEYSRLGSHGGLKLLEMWTLALIYAGYNARKIISASFDLHTCSICSTITGLRHGFWEDRVRKQRYMSQKSFSKRTRRYWDEDASLGFPRLPRGRCIVFEGMDD